MEHKVIPMDEPMIDESEIDLLGLNAWLRSAHDDDDDGVAGDPDLGLATAEAKPELKRPPMYKVLLLNDDYTPMEFVVHILENFFLKEKTIDFEVKFS